MARKKPGAWPACGPCAYFCQETGECRRFPPTFTGLDAFEHPVHSFPVRVATDPACGEFRQRLNS